MKHFFLLLILTLASHNWQARAQEARCVPCLLGQEITPAVQEKMENYMAQMAGPYQRYFEFTTFGGDVVLGFELNNPDQKPWSYLFANYPELLKLLHILPSRREMKKELPYTITESGVWNDIGVKGKYIKYTIERPKTADKAWANNDWARDNNLSITMVWANDTWYKLSVFGCKSCTPLDLPYCKEKECQTDCPKDSLATQFEKINAWDVWSYLGTPLSPCQSENFKKLDGFHHVKNSVYQANDSSFSFSVIPIKDGYTKKTKDRVRLKEIDLRHYKGQHPWGLPSRITIQDLVKTFGTQYAVSSDNRELLFPEDENPFRVALQPGDSVIYLDFHKEDDDPYFDKVTIRTKYETSKWLKPGMKLEGFPQKYGCIDCNDCENGKKCQFRFADGEIYTIDMKDGQPFQRQYTSAEIYAQKQYKKKLDELTEKRLKQEEAAALKEPGSSADCKAAYKKIFSTQMMIELDEAYIKLTQAYANASAEKKKNVHKDISEATASPLRTAGVVWQSRYDIVKKYLDQAKAECQCPELKEVTLLLSVNLGSYLSNMYQPANYMRNFTFGNLVIEEYLNDYSASRDAINTQMNNVKTKYNEVVNKCP